MPIIDKKIDDNNAKRVGGIMRVYRRIEGICIEYGINIFQSRPSISTYVIAIDMLKQLMLTSELT
jgi:hypothetical protein